MKTKKLFYNKDFLLYLIGRMVSDTGSSIQMMTLPLYIIDVGGTAATIGLFSFLSFIPTLIIYPFAGVIGDRLNRKTIMVVTDLISSGVIMAIAILSYWNKLSIPILLVAQVIIILMNGIFEPATRGMLSQLVDKDELTQGNSMVSSMRSAAIMLGPVIGAALYATFGITIVFFVNGISFLLSGISEILIQYKHIKIAITWSIRGIFYDMREGVRFTISEKAISRLCFLLLIIYLIVQPIFSVILPLFFKNSLAYSDVQYGYLQMFIISGAIVGSILVGALFGKGQKLRNSILSGSVMLLIAMIMQVLLTFPWSINTLGNNTARYFIALAAVLFLLSIASTFIVVPVQSYIQKETPNQYVSRVFSLIGLISRGGIPLGGLIYGLFLERFTMHWTLLMATKLMLVASSGFTIILFKTNELQNL